MASVGAGHGVTVPHNYQRLEQLAATPVSRTWKVESSGQLAVLREDQAGAAQLGLNRKAEPRVIRAAAAAGLGPQLLHADPASGVLLTEWLPGRAWSAADIAGNLARVEALLRRLHATPLDGPVVDLRAAIKRYAALAGPAASALATTANGQLDLCLASASAPLCFCHNDPTPGNFIESPDGELRLIDWEYAGLCHPGFELAGLAVAAGLDGGQERRLLFAATNRAVTRPETDAHRHWVALYRSLAGLWEAAIPELIKDLRASPRTEL